MLNFILVGVIVLINIFHIFASNAPQRRSYCWHVQFRSNICWHFYGTRVRSLATLVSDYLTHYSLVDLTDLTLACENANSKLVEVVTVADVDAEDRVDSLVEVLNLNFGRDFEPWFGSWKLVKILRYMFGQDFDADVWLSFKVVTLLIALNPSAFGNVSLFAVKMLNRIFKIC